MDRINHVKIVTPDPAAVERPREKRLVAALRGLLGQAEPGSDIQLAYAHAFAGMAISPTALAAVVSGGS